MNKYIPAAVAALAGLALAATIRPSTVRAAGGTYQEVKDWTQLPAGTSWGVMSWVSTDSKGNVYAYQRDEPTSKVMVFDASGKYLKSWGEGAFEYPHALRVLRDGAVYLTDRKSQQLFRYTPDGKLLMTIGKKDVAGDNASPDTFNGVSDVVMAENGNLFVSDGEGGNTRVVKFTKDGKFIKTWGTKGTGPGQLNGPHCIELDSKGFVYVCDRGNKRIQVFDQDGKYVREMAQFGTPVSIAITKDDTMFVATPAPENFFIVGTTDGKVTQKIEGLDSAHGISVDPNGVVYVAQSSGHMVRKFVKK
jgi:sugar lactone lactonase YvrE